MQHKKNLNALYIGLTVASCTKLIHRSGSTLATAAVRQERLFGESLTSAAALKYDHRGGFAHKATKIAVKREPRTRGAGADTQVLL